MEHAAINAWRCLTREAHYSHYSPPQVVLSECARRLRQARDYVGGGERRASRVRSRDAARRRSFCNTSSVSCQQPRASPAGLGGRRTGHARTSSAWLGWRQAP